MAFDFQYWFDELVKLKKEEGDKNFENADFLRKERARWQKGKFTDLVAAVTALKDPKKNEDEIPSFKEHVEKLREEQINMTQFSEFRIGRVSADAIPYLNESENAEVDKWVRMFEEEHGNDLSQLEEGFLSKVVGGVGGFLLGPTVGKIIANALGVDKGVLYDMFTSRVVSAALGVAIGKHMA